MDPARKALLLVAIAMLVSTGALAQRRSGGSRGGRVNASTGLPPELAHAAIADFKGTLRNFDKKKILLETADGQTLTFHRIKSTQFISTAGHKGVNLGAGVQVEARKDSVGDLEAVRVCESSCSARQSP